MEKREKFEKLNDLLKDMAKMVDEEDIDTEYMANAYNNTCQAIAVLLNENKEDYKWELKDFYGDYIEIFIYDRFLLNIVAVNENFITEVFNPFTEERDEIEFKITDSLKKALIIIRDREKNKDFKKLTKYFSMAQEHLKMLNEYSERIKELTGENELNLNLEEWQFSRKLIEKEIEKTMDKYKCVEDLQGGEFAVGNIETIEEWRQTALAWCDSDGNEGLFKTLESLPESEVIDFIQDMWQIVIEKVE